jgi:hypothetical protein
MDLYTYTVENFFITDTRALHNDSLKLSYSAYINGDAVASRLISLGDFDNGEYSTVDYVPSDEGPGLTNVVINDPTAKVAFIFQLVNAGNVPEGALTGRLAATADQIAGITAGLSGAGATDLAAAVSSPVFGAGLILEAFANLYSWLNVDCDGPVAVDQISGPRYVLDAWTDNATQLIRTQQTYPGSDSPTGCGGNSHYQVTWSLQHTRTWVPVQDAAAGQFISTTGASAAEHNGAVHAFGVGAGGAVNHTRTFTGATWNVDTIGSFSLANLPVTAVSFDDRLYVFGVMTDSSISSLAYTIDGGSWTPIKTNLPALHTNEPIAAAVFRHRLYVFARESTSGTIRMTSTSDLRIWLPWAQVPSPGLQSDSALAAATVAGKLFIFSVFKTGKRPAVAIMRNSTSDGVNWSGWQEIEAGLYPEEGTASDYPLDVAATTFDGRLYIASRWLSPPPDPEHEGTTYLAQNFSEDGDNWSGWRIPASKVTVLPNKTTGIAAVDNHLYLFVPRLFQNTGQSDRVWAY